MEASVKKKKNNNNKMKKCAVCDRVSHPDQLQQSPDQSRRLTALRVSGWRFCLLWIFVRLLVKETNMEKIICIYFTDHNVHVGLKGSFVIF